MPARAVIFANGEIRELDRIRSLLRADDWILAADGGAAHCQRLGVTPAVIIGDLDSLPQPQAQITTIRFPEAKDQTDLELALRYAVGHGAAEILVCGALGGRQDHALANIALGLAPSWADVDLRYDDGETEITFLHGGMTRLLHGVAGDLVSLIALGSDAVGVTTSGLLYPLKHETLAFGSTRGVSNALTGDRASVSLRRGSMVSILTRGRDGSSRGSGHAPPGGET
ncbi:MAG TPA: thiamine diphosphokinase [Anaerolineales bacterium]|nr:thiamine diphosphokinase [Anaerolineales bacterium]